jgi:hypothetical protein
MARIEIQARSLTAEYAFRLLLAHDQRLHDGETRSGRPTAPPSDMPGDLWRLLTADPSELRTRHTERARDRDQVVNCIDRLVAGERLTANAVHELGEIADAGLRVRVRSGPALLTSIVKGAPHVAPNITYLADSPLPLVALALLVLAADPKTRARLARCKECQGLFIRSASPRGHRRREFCPGTRCGARYHERHYRSCRTST